MLGEIFAAGRRISFKTGSKLYPDVYEVEVKAIHSDRLDLHLCFYRGKLLLLPEGTEIRWILPASRSTYTSKVIARDTAQKVWSVTLPRMPSSSPRTRVFAVGSGKGGVGKTTLSINLGLALQHFNRRVVLLDADIGMANIDVLLGIHGAGDLTDVINGNSTLPEILTAGPGGINVLPGSSGISSLTALDSLQFNRIISGFEELEKNCDTLIIDTGAGLSELVLKFLEAADEFILLTSPEPHALMDGYALIKALSRRNDQFKVNLIMNRCESEGEALQSGNNFTKASKKFLGIEPVWLGWLPYDRNITRSIKSKMPLYLSHPEADYSRRVTGIARQLLGLKERTDRTSGLKNFWKRMKNSWLGTGDA